MFIHWISSLRLSYLLTSSLRSGWDVFSITALMSSNHKSEQCSRSSMLPLLETCYALIAQLGRSDILVAKVSSFADEFHLYLYVLKLSIIFFIYQILWDTLQINCPMELILFTLLSSNVQSDVFMHLWWVICYIWKLENKKQIFKRKM